MLIIFSVILGSYGFIRYQIHTPLQKTGEERIFLIEKGDTVKMVAGNLEKSGLIRGAFYFKAHVWFQNISAKLQAGEYLISPNLSIKEIAGKFVQGEVISNEVEITFPEGFTMRDMEKRFRENGFENINLTQFKPVFFGSRFLFLQNIPVSTLEGFLFPDTYRFDKVWLSQQIIEKMLENLDKKLTPELLWEIKKQNKTIFEIITMASLIEKEVRSDEDKKLVSGILWKRFNVGMPLQVDAAIAYVTGKKTGEIVLDDLKINSLYNTYINKGLPIAPISNPGMESMLAAIYPRESPHWYYLSKPDGETVFSETLEEHNRAKIKYLR